MLLLRFGEKTDEFIDTNVTGEQTSVQFVKEEIVQTLDALSMTTIVLCDRKNELLDYHYLYEDKHSHLLLASWLPGVPQEFI